MPDPSDVRRRGADDARSDAAPPKPTHKRLAAHAQAFLAVTVAPALEQAKAHIVAEMDARDGDVTTAMEGSRGGHAALAIRKQGATRNEYVAIILATANTDGIETEMRVSPSMGWDQQPQSKASVATLRFGRKSVDQITRKELADRVVRSYVATMQMMREAGLG